MIKFSQQDLQVRADTVGAVIGKQMKILYGTAAVRAV